MPRNFELLKDGSAAITCAKCHVVAATHPGGTKHGGVFPAQVVAKFFRNKGWHVSNTPRKDLCPDCAKPIRKINVKETEVGRDIKIVEVKPKLVGVSEMPPREMTREDRRILFSKLEEVYVDETTGYVAGWNDERVAKDLNCPRKWVETIREENFGPAHAPDSAEVVAIRERLDKVYTEASAFGTETIEFKAKVQAMVTEALTLNARANTLLSQITAIRDDLKKLTGR